MTYAREGQGTDHHTPLAFGTSATGDLCLHLRPRLGAPLPQLSSSGAAPHLGAEGQLEIAAPGNKEVTICASPGARTPVS